MIIKSKSSMRSSLKKALLAFRAKYGFKPRFTMFEVALKCGLSVEFLNNAPLQFDGYLDPQESPCFIGVNRNLSKAEQVFVVAREIGYREQRNQRNSMVLDQPWKWETLATAPEKIRDKLCLLDAESRAHWLMMAFATGDEFRAFCKAHPKKILATGFAPNIVWFHLYPLRVKNWVRSVLLRTFTVA